MMVARQSKECPDKSIIMLKLMVARQSKECPNKSIIIKREARGAATNIDQNREQEILLPSISGHHHHRLILKEK